MRALHTHACYPLPVVIEQEPFGGTDHNSSRLLFGGAAFKPTSDAAVAARVLEALLRFGVNHIDTAHGYGKGNSETLIGTWMSEHRDRFFLATKTGARTRDEARAELELSLQRLQVSSVDLIQLHNLTDPEGWETAKFAPRDARLRELQQWKPAPSTD